MNENTEFLSDENVNLPETDDCSDSCPDPDLQAQNERLKLELLCAELGVKKDCRDDVIKLSDGGNIQDVIRKYPVFLERSPRFDTGVFIRSDDPADGDASLRRAFGLK